MGGFTDDYYEQAWCRVACCIPVWEEVRAKQTLSLVPGDCISILDVGCGDGRVANRLSSRHRKVVGLERSREALRHVKVEKILGSADFLPFADRSFDLVLCCEVLEHLPPRVYARAIEKMERVAARYIIISVPNNEDLKRSLVSCPRCGCRFNPWRHLRSFSPGTLTKLFSKFRLQTLEFCLPTKVYPHFLLGGARFLGLLPRDPFPVTALCPTCGYHEASTDSPSRSDRANGGSFSGRLIRPLAERLVPRRKRARWLLAVYQRI